MNCWNVIQGGRTLRNPFENSMHKSALTVMVFMSTSLQVKCCLWIISHWKGSVDRQLTQWLNSGPELVTLDFKSGISDVEAANLELITKKEHWNNFNEKCSSKPIYQNLATSLMNLSVFMPTVPTAMVALHEHSHKSETHLVSAGVIIRFTAKKRQTIPL